MVILQSHRTQNMILRCYPNVSAILRRHLVSCAFQQSLYFLLLIRRIFYLLVSALFLHALQYIRREHSSRSFAPPKKWLFASAHVYVRARPGACACAGVAQQLHNFCLYGIVGRTCSKRRQLAWISCAFFPWF